MSADLSLVERCRWATCLACPVSREKCTTPRSDLPFRTLPVQDLPVQDLPVQDEPVEVEGSSYK